MSTIPDGTRFPSKTYAYGKKGRYQIATSTEGGKRSVVNPADQRTRGGAQWAYDTRDKAIDACFALNRERAKKLVDCTFSMSPEFYAGQAPALKAKGEYLAAAIAYEHARAATIGHVRRDRYQAAADECYRLDGERFHEAYTNV